MNLTPEREAFECRQDDTMTSARRYTLPNFTLDAVAAERGS